MVGNLRHSDYTGFCVQFVITREKRYEKRVEMPNEWENGFSVLFFMMKRM